jgi:hypothetical protein
MASMVRTRTASDAWSTQWLLIVTAIAEIGTGLLLLGAPSMIATLLLGAGLESAESILIAKVAGSAVLAIGLSCWLERNRDGTGLIAGLALYNAAVVVLLVYAALVDKMNGIGIWPASGLHTVMLIWCVARLRAG